MKKILVPTDFSGTSRNAEEYALALARVLRAEVELLHVYREALPATAGSEPWTITETDVQTENEKLILKETEYLKRKYAVNVKASVENGLKVRTIHSIAKKEEAGLIVMGLRRSKRQRPLGNTVLNTIRKSSLPVLVIPEQARFSAVKNIILAVDFKETPYASGFDVLLEICKSFDASLHLLHVQEPGTEMSVSEELRKIQMEAILSRFGFDYNKIESYDVEEGIRDFMEQHPADLLVFIAHEHSLYERMFETIHVRAISFKVKLPLLVLKKR